MDDVEHTVWKASLSVRCVNDTLEWNGNVDATYFFENMGGDELAGGAVLGCLEDDGVASCDRGQTGAQGQQERRVPW